MLLRSNSVKNNNNNIITVSKSITYTTVNTDVHIVIIILRIVTHIMCPHDYYITFSPWYVGCVKYFSLTKHET